MILQISTQICLKKKKSKKRSLYILQRMYWRFVWDFECWTRCWFKLTSIQMNTGKPLKLLIASHLGISYFSSKLFKYRYSWKIVVEALKCVGNGTLWYLVWKWWRVLCLFFWVKWIGMVIWHGSGRRAFEATCIRWCSLSFTNFLHYWVLIHHGSW